MEAKPHMKGYLLKRNKEHRKANLIGAKYKRRWVELTADTLVYSGTQQELLTGKIQVFSVHEMLWVKKDGDAKFQVKFPERTLTFKVENGGSAERDKWVVAVEACKELEAVARSRRASAGKLEQLKKTAEELLLNPEPQSITALKASTLSSARAGGLHHRADADAAGYNLLDRTSSVGAAPPSLASTSVSSHRTSETGQRPPSPRSLLASARAGLAFVNSGNGSTPGTPHYESFPGNSQGKARAALQEFDVAASDGEQDDGDDDDDGGSEDGNYGAAGVGANAAAASARSFSPRMNPPPIRGGSLDLARNSLELGPKGSKDRPGSGLASCSSPLPAATAAAVGPSQEGSNSGAPASPSSRNSRRRESLQRKLTPGVMLINTSMPPTPVTSMTLYQSTPRRSASDSDSPSALASSPARAVAAADADADADAGAEEQVLVLGASEPTPAAAAVKAPPCQLEVPSPAVSSCSTPIHSSPAKQQSQQQQQTGLGPTAAADDDFCDEILRLDPSDLLGNSSSSSSPHGATCTTASVTSSHVYRPSSAPQHRPGTPLKSCLRSSRDSSSSLPGVSHPGSMSTPSSIGAATAAAAGLGTSSSGHALPSSPLGKLGSAACHTSKAVSSSREWLHDDWDESSEAADETSPSAGGSMRAGSTSSLNGFKVQQSGGSFSALSQQSPGGSGQRVVSSRGGACGSKGAAHGIAADGNWLDEDFDS